MLSCAVTSHVKGLVSYQSDGSWISAYLLSRVMRWKSPYKGIEPLACWKEDFLLFTLILGGFSNKLRTTCSFSHWWIPQSNDQSQVLYSLLDSLRWWYFGNLDPLIFCIWVVNLFLSIWVWIILSKFLVSFNGKYKVPLLIVQANKNFIPFHAMLCII